MTDDQQPGDMTGQPVPDNQALANQALGGDPLGGEAPVETIGDTRALPRAVVVHIGLIGVAIGALLPWTTIGGLPRSGPALANLSLSLADLGFSTPLSAIGFGWYSIPILALVAWLTLWRAFPPNPGRTTGAITAILLVVTAVFWALVSRGPFLGSHIGATVCLTGAGISLFGCRYPRPTMVRTEVSDVL